ncbi:MAG: RdgB/HAM1 family non-canonical purine pyrophosphatase [Actinomycetota bacterium]|jgi:XTP/dITP diphosphohydrolase
MSETAGTLSPRTPVVVATHNAHKVEEIARTLKPLVGSRFELCTYDGPEPVEDGDTFEANALIKARAAFEHTGLASLADDSGIVVTALDGAPGIRSARYSPEGTDASNRDLLLANLGDAADRSAKFVCVVALVTDEYEITVRGEWAGSITSEVRGSGGFGYDPIFVPAGDTVTAAELSPLEKSTLSHRGRALGLIAPHMLRVIPSDSLPAMNPENAAAAE